MPEGATENPAQRWEERWRGSETEERLTLLGRRMFAAKGQVIRRLVQTMRPATVIEVGCGLGHVLAIYQEEGLVCRGIDLSPTAVAVCRRKGLTADLQDVADLQGSFDLVSSDGMLEHFLNFEPMARHLMRLSRHRVLLVQPNHGSFWGRTLPYLSEWLRGDENVFEYNYRIGDFIGVFAANGFEVVANIPVFADVFRILLFQRSGSVVAGRE